MTERKMTERGFLAKSSKIKVSASAFIAAHREYLESGTLGSLTTPILVKFDKGDILPTPALTEIRQAVMEHMIAVQITKSEAKILAASTTKSSKPFTATILDAQGKIVTYVNSEGDTKDMIANFDNDMQAQDWCDRRLFDGAPDWYGKIVDNRSQYQRTIDRNGSVARTLRSKRGPTMKTSGSKSAPLRMSGKVHVKGGSSTHFSRG